MRTFVVKRLLFHAVECRHTADIESNFSYVDISLKNTNLSQFVSG